MREWIDEARRLFYDEEWTLGQIAHHLDADLYAVLKAVRSDVRYRRALHESRSSTPTLPGRQPEGPTT